jgi:hypothetical protein
VRQKPLHPDAFETALGLGDLALGRARAALGLPAVDDDYGAVAVYTPHPNPPPQGGRESCETTEAEHCYREAGRFAEEQDQRLQTRWHGDTVQDRQARLNRLRSL